MRDFVYFIQKPLIEWHSKGQEFESPMLHQIESPGLSAKLLIAGVFSCLKYTNVLILKSPF